MKKEHEDYLRENMCSFGENTGQNPGKIQMFSEKSQWVYGNTIDECLEAAINYKHISPKPPQWFKNIQESILRDSVDCYLRGRYPSKDKTQGGLA